MTKMHKQQNTVKAHSLFYSSLILLFCITLVAYTVPSFGESKIDSLKTSINKSKADSAKTHLYIELGWAYFDDRQLDSTLLYADKALTLAQKISFKRVMAEANNLTGGVYSTNGDLPHALAYYKASLNIRKEINDTLKLAPLYSNIGMVYYKQASFTESLTYFFKALESDKRNKDSTGISTDYTYIGLALSGSENYTEALAYYKKALEIQQLRKDTTNMIPTIVYIADNYYATDNRKAAMENYELILRLVKRNPKNKYPLGYYYVKTGEIYTEEGRYELALKNLQESVKIYNELGELQGIAKANYRLGILYIRLKNAQKGDEVLEKALFTAKEIGDVSLLKDVYKALSCTDSLSGNYQSAWNNYKQYIYYKDSLFNEKNTKEITRLQLNQEFSQKEDSINMANEKKLAVKEATLTAQKRQKWLMSGGLGLLCVIGGLLFYQNKTQKRNNLQLLKLNSELDEKALQNEVLVKEMHHRIKNNLYMIYSLLNIQSHSTDNVETQEQLKSAKQRIESIANTHEQLYRNKPEKIALNDYIRQFVQSTVQQLTLRNHIEKHIDIEMDILLNTATCMPLAMLINELLTNSIKYKYNVNTLHIYLKAYKTTSGEVSLEYHDRAEGLNNNHEVQEKTEVQSSGIGTRIIHLLSKQIGAKLNDRYNNLAYHYQLTFPAQ